MFLFCTRCNWSVDGDDDTMRMYCVLLLRFIYLCMYLSFFLYTRTYKEEGVSFFYLLLKIWSPFFRFSLSFFFTLVHIFDSCCSPLFLYTEMECFVASSAFLLPSFLPCLFRRLATHPFYFPTYFLPTYAFIFIRISI